ncbi:MAG: M56 family metallopeptidase [Erysipelotrichaceae bacterium]|nr:M56 family metallopeptidase [Erysipelotrichaceae bacterium]
MYQYVLNRTIDSLPLIVTVLLIRTLFKRQPKWFNVCLYGLIGIKLLMPDIFKTYYSFNRVYALNNDIKTAVNSLIVTNETASISILPFIYYVGLILMLSYFVITYVNLYRTLKDSVKLKDNIYFSDRINTPFLFNQKIYLPADINEEIDYVIKHEQAHLKRGDGIYKIIGFIFLSVYWFNPLIWLSYHFMCKDIEEAADEKVIKNLDAESKSQYAKALLKHAKGGYHLSTVAFGEVSVKERIKNILDYRKPALWMIISCIVLIAVLSFGFLSSMRKSDFDLKVTVPAGNAYNNPVTVSSQISSVSGSIKFIFTDDIEVVLVNMEDSEDVYTVNSNRKIKLNKDSWYNVLVYKENSTEKDIEVNIRVSNVELRIEDAVNIFDFKTDFIGDNVNVNAIAELLPYPDGYIKDYIEIKTSAKPYELIVHLKGKGTKEEKDFAGAANLAFNLIGNMDVFTIVLEDSTEISFVDSAAA